MAYTTIDDPSAHFQTKIYTGNGSSGHAITFDGNANMQPDWLWNKVRGAADAHAMFDSTRGVNKLLFPNSTAAEGTDGNGNLESFDSNGFTVGGNQYYANNNGSSQVTWAWKANGGTTSSNSDGSITSTVQANTTAGFSIVTYTGTQSNATVGHGLGAVPSWIITKSRSGTAGWPIFHHKNTSAPETELFRLNETAATADNSVPWNDTAPTSTVFTVGANDENNKSGATQIAYCFAEKQGYSKFGSYTGNGNADGPFVYTGFKPAWVMVKKTSDTGNWIMFDNKRDSFNLSVKYLFANTSDAEASNSSNGVDFLSNGFKMRTAIYGDVNSDGGTYLYMTFAESPFVSSAGVPTTAK